MLQVPGQRKTDATTFGGVPRNKFHTLPAINTKSTYNDFETTQLIAW